MAGRTGAPLRRPRAPLADCGYDSEDRVRRPLSDCGIAPLVARRDRPLRSGLCAWRYVAEQTIKVCDQFRRLRTRFDRRDDVPKSFMDPGAV